ncbi:radical SAM/SPASM domain-containing protein [Candidatus Omnitrophota bacterium]
MILSRLFNRSYVGFRLSKYVFLKENSYSLENDRGKEFVWLQGESAIVLKFSLKSFSYDHDLILVYAKTRRVLPERFLALKGDKGGFRQKIIPGWNTYAFPIRALVHNDACEKTISLQVSSETPSVQDAKNLGLKVNSIMITSSLPHLHHVCVDTDIKEKFNFNFPPLPSAITLDLTTRCNYSCPMCYRTVRFPGNIDLDYEAAIKTAACFNDTKVRIDLSASGEPLLYPHFNKLMKHLSSHKNIHISFLTNGFLIDKFLDACLCAHSIGISLESLKNYNFTRKGGEVEKIISNIRLLKKYGLKTLCLQVIPMRFNLEELPDIIQFARDNDIAVVAGQHLECFQKNDAFWREQSCFFCKEEYDETYKKIHGMFENLNFPPPFIDQQKDCEFTESREGGYANRVLCSSPFLEARIDANGNIMLCCGVDTLIVGNIRTTPFTEIWNGQICRNIRNSILEERPICKCGITSTRGRTLNQMSSAVHELKRK